MLPLFVCLKLLPDNLLYSHVLFCMISGTGFDEDIASITSGKEFGLVKTTGGKVGFLIY